MGTNDTSLVDHALRAFGISPESDDPRQRAESLRAVSEAAGRIGDVNAEGTNAAGMAANVFRQSKIIAESGAKFPTGAMPKGPAPAAGAVPTGGLSGAKLTASRVALTLMAARAALAAFDAISTTLFGFSVVDEWIKKPFVGDWDEMTVSAEAWRAMAVELDNIRGDIEQLSKEVDGWLGQSAQAYATAQRQAAQGVAPTSQAARDIANALDITVELGANILDIVSNAITLTIGVCQRIAAEQAVPLAGQIVGAIEITLFIGQAIQIALQVNSALASFVECTTLLSCVILEMDVARDELQALTN